MVTILCLGLAQRRRRCGHAMVALALCLTVAVPAASQGPLGQPIGGGLPPAAPKQVKRAPRPAPAPVPVPTDQFPAPDQAGLGDPIGGMSQPLRVANPFMRGRYPTFGMGDDSYGIEMSLWPEDMELADGLLQWRVNVVRFSPAVSSNYRTPLRPDGYVTGVGAITATMSLSQNGTCISVLSVGGRAMAKIEVACSRGPGLMFRVLKPPRQTRWIVVDAVYRETDGQPTVIQEYLADMWTGKVWQVADFRSEGFTIEPCSGEARTLWNSASAQRLGLRTEDCLNTMLWPSDENRLGRQTVIAARQQEDTSKTTPSPDETATWLASYRDNFLGGEVRVTTIAQARVRSYPTSDGSIVVQTLPPDTAISGRWVTGRDPTTRWLRRAGTGDYVWEGNLTTAPSQRFIIQITPASLPLAGLSTGETKGTIRVNVGDTSFALYALSNGQFEGQTDLSKSPNQCVDLIRRYGFNLGLFSSKTALGDGLDVARNFATKSGGKFQYIDGDRASSLPVLGSVVSISNVMASGSKSTSLQYGHVGIVQKVSEQRDGSFIVTLFDQNFPMPSGLWKIVTFKKVDGGWMGTMTNSGTPIKVAGWSNPVGY